MNCRAGATWLNGDAVSDRLWHFPNATLKKVGASPSVQGVVLWVIVGVVTLLLLRADMIDL